MLIAYGTHEGHTRKIAQRLVGFLNSHDVAAEEIDTADLPEHLDLSVYDGFILAGSVHQGSHQRSLAHFIKAHQGILSHRPTLFLSVSLTAVHKDEEHQKEVLACIDRFLGETGWTPSESLPVEGALRYVEYDWFKRMVMKSIVKHQGGDIDTSRDYEYTNWEYLEKHVLDFVRHHFATEKASVQ